MANKKEMSELKKRALLAKQRLKMGYWQKLERERPELLAKFNGDLKQTQQLQRESIARDTMLLFDSDKAKREEEMYKKVCQILDNDEEITNPIGLLIDKELYAGLDDMGRQKYVLEIAEKFRNLSARYEMERRAKSAVGGKKP